MSTGYLTTLAARALSASPTLAPRRPSRFEPRSGAPALRATTTDATHGAGPAIKGLDVLDVIDAAVGEADHVPQRGPAPRTTYPRNVTMRDDHAPVVRPLRPPLWRPAEVEDPLAAAESRGPVGHPPARRGTMGSAAGDTPGAARPDALIADWSALEPRRTPDPVVPDRHALLRHVDANGQPAIAGTPAGPRLRAAGGEPTIVVRIGRIDVRAVHAPAPPAPPARAPEAPRSSLADHLLARDRGRR